MLLFDDCVCQFYVTMKDKIMPKLHLRTNQDLVTPFIDSPKRGRSKINADEWVDSRNTKKQSGNLGGRSNAKHAGERKKSAGILPP